MKKKFSRVIAHYLPQCLLLVSILTSNVLFPATVIAQEIENTNNVIQEETVPIDTSEDILEEGISTSIYEEEEVVEPLFVFENGIYTVNTVVEGEEYVYPDNKDVRVKFTEVTQEGNLVIKRVELTEEQKELLNTKDNYGWDITSSMDNGTFKYNLTLPNTQGNNDIEVKYTEDGNNYESIEGVSNINNNNIVIEGLDHFTMFVVINPLPVKAPNQDLYPIAPSSSTNNTPTQGTTSDTGLKCEAGSIINQETGAQYKSIQEAIDNAGNGDTLCVGAGEYKEQILIKGKTVKIIGDPKEKPIIVVPHQDNFRVPLCNPNGYENNSPIVCAFESNVVIQNLIINANYFGQSIGGKGINGITLLNSSGTIKDVEIKNVRYNGNPPKDANIGIGILVYNDGTAENKVTIETSYIHDYQKTGIIASGEGLNILVGKNIIEGLGEQANYQCHGILYTNSATGGIISNTISASQSYDHPNEGKYTKGICALKAGSNLVISDNEVEFGTDGIYVEKTGSDLKISGNKIHDNLGSGIALYGSSMTGSTILGNELKNIIGLYLSSDVPDIAIYTNTFDSKTNAIDYGSHHFDNGELGNRWSDYKGYDLDADGIGDTEDYIIDDDSIDRFPLTSNQLSASVTEVTTNKRYYKIGDTLTINVTVKNTGTVPFNSDTETLAINIMSPSNTYVDGTFAESRPFSLNAGENTELTFYTTQQTIPSTWAEGTYTVHTSIYSSRVPKGYLDGGQYRGTPFVVDNQKPSIEILSPEANSIHKDTLNILVQGTDTKGLGLFVVNLYKTGGSLLKSCVNQNMNGVSEGTVTCTINTKEYTDGSYYIKTNVKDLAGNISSTPQRTFIFDNTVPTGSITSIYYPDKDISVYSFITNDNTPILEGTCSDANINTVKLTIDGTGEQTLTCNSNTWRANPTTTLLDGSHTATLTITDKAGNILTTTQALFIDTKAPFAAHIYYKNGIAITDTKTFVKAVSELSFTATYTDDLPSSGILKDSYVIFDSNADGTARTNKAYCAWRDTNNTIAIPYTSVIPFTNCEPSLSDGQYFMYHQVYDNATRQDIPTITQYRDVKGLYFIVDTQAPTSAISITGNLAETKELNHNNGWHGNGWYHDFAEVELSIPTTSTLDPNEKIQYEILSNDVLCPGTLTSPIEISSGTDISTTINSLTDGVHTLCYQAKDSAGNLETVKKELLKLDRTLPTYTISNISGNLHDGTYYNLNTISFDIKGEDSHSGYYRTRYDISPVDESGNCTEPWTSHTKDLSEASPNLTQTLSVSGLDNGKYCLKVWVYDDVQNKAWADTNGVSIIHFEIDNTKPQGEIKGIRYDSQDIEGYFITNDNTPKLFGTCSDTNIDTVKLTYGTNEQTLECNNGNWEADMTQLSDGKYLVTLTITDKAGNQTTDSKDIIIDTVAPTAQYTYYKNGKKITDSKAYVSSINELTYTGIFKDENSSGLYKDVLVVFRKSDNKAYCSWSQSLSPTGGVSLSGNSYELTTQQNVSKCVNSLPEGEYYIRHRVYDNAIRRDAPAYHQHTQYTTLEFVIDSTAPTVEITSPSENSILRGTVEIKGSVTDNNLSHYNISIYKDGDDTQDSSLRIEQKTEYTSEFSEKTLYTWDTTNGNFPDGVYQIRLAARDKAGNRDLNGISEQIIKVTVDNTAPTTTLASNLSNTYTNKPIFISGQSIDTNGVDSVNIFYRVTGTTDWTSITTLDNTPNTSPYDWSYTWTPLSDGTYDIKISATDTVGNIEQSAYISSLTYDSTAPTITVFGIASDILNISATDSLSGTDKIEVKINDGEWITYTTDMNLNTLLNNTPGTYTIYARVTDKAGNTTQGSTTYTIPTPAVLGATTGPTTTTTTTTTKPSVKGTTTTKTTSNISEDTQTEELLETTSIEEPSVLGERCENKKKVSGYVYIDENKDKEMNDNEEGIKDITLTIQYTDEEGNIKTEEEVNTDEKGYWETQLCSGKYNIVVKKDTLPKNIEVSEVLSLTVSDNEEETIFNIQALDTRNFWQKYWYLIVGGLAIIVIGYISIKNRKKEEI